MNSIRQFYAFLDSCVEKMRTFDVSATKISVLFFTLFLVKLWPPVASLDWRIYLGLSALVALPVVARIFASKGWIIFYLGFYLLIYLAVEYLTTL